MWSSFTLLRVPMPWDCLSCRKRLCISLGKFKVSDLCREKHESARAPMFSTRSVRHTNKPLQLEQTQASSLRFPPKRERKTTYSYTCPVNQRCSSPSQPNMVLCRRNPPLLLLDRGAREGPGPIPLPHKATRPTRATWTNTRVAEPANGVTVCPKGLDSEALAAGHLRGKAGPPGSHLLPSFPRCHRSEGSSQP